MLIPRKLKSQRTAAASATAGGKAALRPRAHTAAAHPSARKKFARPQADSACPALDPVELGGALRSPGQVIDFRLSQDVSMLWVYV